MKIEYKFIIIKETKKKQNKDKNNSCKKEKENTKLGEQTNENNILFSNLMTPFKSFLLISIAYVHNSH